MRNEDLLSSSVSARLNEHGFASRFVSFEHVRELKDAIEKAHSEQLFDEEFYRYLSSWFDFAAPAELSDIRSVIIVASTHPALKVTFMLQGQPHETIIPPTYTYGTDQEACDCITEVLEPRGYRVITAKVPEKLLAVRSGLAKYGKNNITYVEGMGSFHRLAALYTNAPLFEQSWQEPRMLDQCQTCSACVKKCPSGAIPSDRFLLRAEKCLTFHNESEAPFPEWIDPSWHNCLIGCMICQNVCPANKPFIGWIVDEATFSEEETDLILRDAPKENLPPETQEKLERINMLKDSKLLSRNLNALLNARN
ncbi:MAG: epoxyqueuosine reductase [Candidatus Zixiibacteriota bacterium]|nr:MAG: epoxyqueuosine reductase [candidate division Zixibacteria bacterium]